MSEKLLELTPEKVKELMEEVIRTHLGWLIVSAMRPPRDRHVTATQ